MALSSKKIVMGTRGSRLALAQYEEVKRLIGAKHPEVDVELKVVSTQGDENHDRSVASLGVGVFVRDIETALLQGDIDVAVHSLKDLPTTVPDGLTIAGVPYREDPRDAVVSRRGCSLEDLQPGSIVATGSARRRALVHSMRDDLILKPIRGNVTTRLEQLDKTDGDIDALVLAVAGLKRLGRQARISQYLSCMSFTSAPGQGALALETRFNDDAAISICKSIEHQSTRRCVDAERAFLSAIGGGCSAPIGAHARIDDDTLTMAVFVADPAGSQLLRGIRDGPSVSGEQIAQSLAEELTDSGALELLPSLSPSPLSA